MNKANDLKLRYQNLDLFKNVLAFVVNLSDKRVSVLTNCTDATEASLSDGQ